MEGEDDSQDVQIEGGEVGAIGVVYFCVEAFPETETVEVVVGVVFEVDVPGFVLNAPF